MKLGQNHFYFNFKKESGVFFISFRFFFCTVIYTGAYTQTFKIARKLTP